MWLLWNGCGCAKKWVWLDLRLIMSPPTKNPVYDPGYKCNIKHIT